MTEYGGSAEIRKRLETGQLSVSLGTNNGLNIALSFASTRPNANYMILVNTESSEIGSGTGIATWVSAKTTTGMTVQVRKTNIASVTPTIGTALILNYEVWDQ